MTDTMMRVVVLSAAVLALLAVVIVLAERAAIYRTLGEINNLPEKKED